MAVPMVVITLWVTYLAWKFLWKMLEMLQPPNPSGQEPVTTSNMEVHQSGRHKPSSEASRTTEPEMLNRFLLTKACSNHTMLHYRPPWPPTMPWTRQRRPNNPCATVAFPHHTQRKLHALPPADPNGGWWANHILMDGSKRSSLTQIYILAKLYLRLLPPRLIMQSAASSSTTYPEGRNLNQIRIVAPDYMRLTTELQMFIPNKFARNFRMTPKQMMEMITQTLNQLGCHMNNAEAIRLKANLDLIKPDHIPDGLNAGFSTETYYHLRIKIESKGVSANGQLPNTIPFVSHRTTWITPTIAENQIGSIGGQGLGSKTDARNIATTVSKMSSGNSASSKKGKQPAKGPAQNALYQQNLEARTGRAPSDPRSFTILVTAGPSQPTAGPPGTAPPAFSIKTRHLSYKQVAKIVGINVAMLVAVGDVMELARQSFEYMIKEFLSTARDLASEIIHRLFYQYVEMHIGGDIASEIVISYITDNEERDINQANMDIITNMFSSHANGETHLYNKGFKGIIRRPNMRKVKRSTEIKIARREIQETTVSAPYIVTIKAATGMATTIGFIISRVIFMFDNAPALTTKHIEHIGPLTANNGIYIAFTDHDTAAIVHYLFSQRSRSFYEIFSYRYLVSKSFQGTKGLDSTHMKNSYPSFFLPHQGIIPSLNPLPPPPVPEGEVTNNSNATSSQSYKDVFTSNLPADISSAPDMEEIPMRKESPPKRKASEATTHTERQGKRATLSVSPTQIPRSSILQYIEGQSKPSAEGLTMTQMAAGSNTLPTYIDNDTASATPSQTQQASSLDLDLTPHDERISDLLSASSEWLNLDGKFIHHNSKLTLQGSDHLFISFPYVPNSDLIHAYDNDCVPVCLAHMVRHEKALEHPLGHRHPFNYDDITLLLEYEQQHSDRLTEQQKEKFSQVLETFATCIGKQLFGKAYQAPTLEESLTGDIVLDLLQPNVILIHQEDHTCKLISSHPDVTLEFLLEDATRPKYLLLFMDSHLDIVPFSLYASILGDLLITARQETRQAPLPVIPGIHTLLAKQHYGSSLSQNRKRNRTSPPTTREHSPVLYDSDINPGEQVASPVELASSYIETVTPASLSIRTSLPQPQYVPVLDHVSDDRAQLAAHLQPLAEWRGMDCQFLHLPSKIKLDLRGSLPNNQLRMFLRDPVLLPEYFTCPNDCGVWHLCQYFQFLCGMAHHLWTAAPLTLNDLGTLHHNMNLNPTHVDRHLWNEILLRYMYYLSPLDHQRCHTRQAPQLEDAPTMDLILQTAKPPFFLYQVDPHHVEIICTNHALRPYDLMNPALPHYTHVFLFQREHVRLVHWQPIRYALHAALSIHTIHLGQLFLPTMQDRDLPLWQHIGSTPRRSLRLNSSTSSSSRVQPDQNHNGTTPPAHSTTLHGPEDIIASSDSANSTPESQTNLFPIFMPSTTSTADTTTGFTAAQWAQQQYERQVGHGGLPALTVSSNIDHSQPNYSDDSHFIDTETDVHYKDHQRGINKYRPKNVKLIGSGLDLIGVMRRNEIIPICGKFRRTCTIAQLRRTGGVTELPGGLGYIIESYIWDAGYGSSARRKLNCAANFGRLVTLVAFNDPRLNLELSQTTMGHPVLRPLRTLRGTPHRPIPLCLGHPGIPLLTAPIPPPNSVQNFHRMVEGGTAPFFRPSGRRRDPSVAIQRNRPLPLEEQPIQYDMQGDLPLADVDNETSFGGTHADCNSGCVNLKGNGLHRPLLTKLVTLYKKRKLDVLTLLDPGFTNLQAARTVLKEFFGSAHIYIVPAKPPRLANRHYSRATGGMVIITNEKRVKIQRHFVDPSGLGIHHTIRIAVRHNITDLMFLYWPSPQPEDTSERSGHSDSMRTKLTDYLQQTNNDLLPDDWIKSQIRNRCPSILQQMQRHFILMGDCNRTFDPHDIDNPDTLAGFMTSLGLTTVLKSMLDERGKNCNSFFRGTQATEIDHIFTSIPVHLITNGGRGDPTYWCDDGDTDHVPCWLGFTLLNDCPMEQTSEQHLTISAMATLDKDSANTRAIVTQVLTAWWDNHPHNPEVNSPQANPSLEEIGGLTEALSRGMAQEVIYALGKRERSHKRGSLKYSRLWSPKAGAISQHHQAMSYLQRVFNSSKSIGTKLRSCKRRVEQWAEQIRWRQLHANIRYEYKPDHEGCTTANEWISIIEQAQHTEGASFDERLRACDNLNRLAQLDKRTLGRKLHVRQRKQYLEDMGKAVASRESKLIDKQLKSAFKSLTEKQQGAYNFSELTLPDGSTTTDPQKIHEEVSKYFSNIFDNPSNALPTKCNLELPNFESLPQWERMLEDKEFFKQVYENQGIPSDVVEKIAEAFCQPDRRADAQAHIERALSEPFKFEDFVRIIKRSRGNSAGGITGLNYGILKLAPESLLQYLFDLCSTMWDSKYIPPYWQIKYLHLLVKDMSKSGLNNLRPIGLIEVLRKIWSNLVIHRIRLALSDSKFLAETQYGFVSRKGTTDELIQLTNVLEAAAEGRHDLELTTWDITKAFDSVGRTLQLITWLRMGVPMSIALWFVNLDHGGYFIVRSPWASHYMSTLNPTSLPTDIINRARLLGFQAKRGFTQGDVLSTTGWVGFFDILLRALETVEDKGKFFYRGEGIHLHQQEAMAYADDLVTISTTREQTNSFSRIICGFMALFGLKLAPDKIRSSTTLANPGELKYYDWTWTEHTNEFGSGETPIKILGIILSANGSWEAQYTDLLLHCQKIAQTVGRKMASLSLKTTVLLTSTLAQILYRTQVISLTDKQLDKLTKLLMGVLRDYHTIGRTFPTLVLTSKLLSGIFTDVRTATAKRKWNIMGRMLAIGGAQSNTMQSLLGRLHRVGYRDSSPNGQSADIIKPKVGALTRWADTLPNSLLPEHVLRYFGIAQLQSPTLLHDIAPALDIDSAELLEELDIHYVTELMPDGRNLPVWLNATNMPTFQKGIHALRSSQTLESIRQSPAPAPGCPITPGQFYTFLGPHYKKRFFEVDGLLPSGNIAGRWWDKPRNSNVMRPMGEHGNRGDAHAGLWDPTEYPFNTSQRTLVCRPGGLQDPPRFIGIQPVAAVPTQDPVFSPAPWVQRILDAALFDPSEVTTAVSDASYTRSQTDIHSLFSLKEAPPTQAGGAFVLLANNRPVLGVQIKGMENLDDYNAFVGELFTGVAMSQFRATIEQPIDGYMDCKSVIDASGSSLPMTSDFYVNLQEDYGAVLHQFHRLRRETNQPPLKWTRGHPDQDLRKADGKVRKAIPRREWGPQEYGIYVADHLADLTPDASRTLLNEGLMPTHVVEVHITDILRSLTTAGQWFRCSRSDNTIPLFQPPAKMMDTAHFQRYCLEREQKSQRDNRWSSVQLGLLKPTLKLLHANSWASKWAKYMRIIIDRLPHGRNIAKGQGNDAPIPPCPLCHDGEDSLEHLTHCQYSYIKESRQTLFRSLDDKLHTYCRQQDLPDAVLTISREYLFACASTNLPDIDILGGWLGIPVPRFISFFSPNCPISADEFAGLLLTIPRIIADCLDWLHMIWRKRCSIVHATSASNSQSATATASQATDDMSDGSFRQSNRWSVNNATMASSSMNSTPASSASQQSIVSFISGSGDPTRSPSSLQPSESSSLRDEVTVPTGQAATSISIQPPSRPVTRSINNLIGWHFRDRRDCLDMLLSNEWAPSLATRCAQLLGHFSRVPLTRHYLLSFPHQFFLGNSKILGAGRGCYLETSPSPVLEGSVMGEYFGNSTANGGIDPDYLVNDADPPGRDDGAYLLQNQHHYIVDAHVDCAMGYLNDPFELANCFFQPNPDNPCQILIVNRIVFPSNGVFELTVNYGWDYWSERLHLLSPDAQARCIAFYHPNWVAPS